MRLLENTLDWYAQDTAGNIWYLGEDTKEYEDGMLVSTAGSFEHGVDGAQGRHPPSGRPPGRGAATARSITRARPRTRPTCSRHRRPLPRSRSARSTACLQDQGLPRRSIPRTSRSKYYARGVGPVLTLAVSKDSRGREELISFTKP